MKDAEDEAFDELARKQGSWGGGYRAKKAMAADKLQEPAGERAWFTIAELNAWADKKLAENPQWAMPTDEPEQEALAQPAQEPVSEALKLALEALEESQTDNDTMEFWDRKSKAITAIKKALAQPVQQEAPIGRPTQGEK